MKLFRRQSELHFPSLTLAFLTIFCYGFSDNLKGPFFEKVMEDFAFSDSVGSLFFLIPSLSGFLASFFYFLTVKVSLTAHSTLRVALALMSLSLLGLSQTHNPTLFFSFCFLYGLGLGLLSVAQNILVAGSTPVALRRQFLSGLHSQYAFSSLVATFFVYLTQEFLYWDWRDSFLFSAGLMFLVFIFSFTLRSNSKNRKSLKFEVYKIKDLLDFKKLLFGLILSFYLVGEVTLSTRLVLYMTREEGLSLSGGNNFLLMFFAFLFFSRTLFFLFKFPIKNFHTLVLCTTLGGVCVAAGVLVSPVFLSVSGLLVGPFFGVFMDYLNEIFKGKTQSVISSVVSFAILNLAVLHFILGYVTEFHGVAVAVLVSSIGFFLSAGLLIYEKLKFS